MKWKNFHFKKNYKYGIKAPIQSHTCIFFWNQNFSHFKKNYKCWIKCISKKFTSVGSANTCNFFDIFLKKLQVLDQVKLPKSQTKWTGQGVYYPKRTEQVISSVFCHSYVSKWDPSRSWKRSRVNEMLISPSPHNKPNLKYSFVNNKSYLATNIIN